MERNRTLSNIGISSDYFDNLDLSRSLTVYLNQIAYRRSQRGGGLLSGIYQTIATINRSCTSITVISMLMMQLLYCDSIALLLLRLLKNVDRLTRQQQHIEIQ